MNHPITRVRMRVECVSDPTPRAHYPRRQLLGRGHCVRVNSRRAVASSLKGANTMAINRVHLLKFFELALAIICMALHYHSQTGSNSFHELMIISAAFGGYIVILVGILTGIFTGQPVNKRIDIFYSLVGCALFVAAGSFVIQYFDRYYGSKETRNIGLSKGAIAIINGVVFLVDSVLSFRGE